MKNDGFIGLLNKDLTLKNLQNETLFDKVSTNLREHPNSIDAHNSLNLPDGKSGIFFISMEKQAYVDCINHDYLDFSDICLRLFRILHNNKAARYKTYKLCSIDPDLKELEKKKLIKISQFARNCVKQMMKEKDFNSMKLKLETFQKQAEKWN